MTDNDIITVTGVTERKCRIILRLTRQAVSSDSLGYVRVSKLWVLF